MSRSSQTTQHGAIALDAQWRESYAGVARVLRQTVRASSAVECLNGVLRMHQSRHKTVTQGLLDRLFVFESPRS